jgi:cytochrome P450
VVRDDAPVQNTRRFADREVTLMGSQIARGDAVLVVVAAANRDPRATRTYTFGLGAHACPGMRMATTIAAAGVAGLLAAGVDVAALSVTGYLPRENVRIPDFVRS